MNSEQLTYILGGSSCVSKRQLRDYVQGTLTNEEVHAIEVHLISCPLCSDAIEGLFEQKEKGAVASLAGLNNNFLKDHFGRINPQIHLNSLAPAAAHKLKHKKTHHAPPVFSTSTIAAGLILAAGVVWYTQYGKDIAKNYKRPERKMETVSAVVDNKSAEAVNFSQTSEENTIVISHQPEANNIVGGDPNKANDPGKMVVPVSEATKDNTPKKAIAKKEQLEDPLVDEGIGDQPQAKESERRKKKQESESEELGMMVEHPVELSELPKPPNILRKIFGGGGEPAKDKHEQETTETQQ
jgi:hypothetical protein